MSSEFKPHTLQRNTAALLQAGNLLEDGKGGESPANQFVQMYQV